MKASLFITCIADAMYANVGISAVNVLRKLGVEIDFPKKQTCCGQPVYNSGYFEGTNGQQNRAYLTINAQPNY